MEPDHLQAAMRAARRRRRRRALTEPIYPAALLATALVAWWLWVNVYDAPTYLWPSLSDVGRLLLDSSEMRSASLATIELILVGFLVAFVVAIAIAGVTASVRLFELGIFPLLVASQFVPLIALAPLFVVWWGFGETPKLVVVILFGYFPLVVTALTGLRSLEVEKTYLARSMGASGLRTFLQLRLPQSLPSVFAGLKITWTSCVIGAVVGEFIVGSSGLGYLILRAQGIGDSATVVAGVVYLSAIGAIGYILISVAERALLPWHASRRSTAAAAAA
jgi:NitT/TauT family transport system permease protein